VNGTTEHQQQKMQPGLDITMDDALHVAAAAAAARMSVHDQGLGERHHSILAANATKALDCGG
jgi:hypothetical protein